MGDFHYRAYLDGEDVSRRTTRGRSGPEGYVVQYKESPDGDVICCPCRQGAVEIVQYGQVTFEWMSTDG